MIPKKKLNILPSNPEVQKEGEAVGLGRFPSWLHRPLPKGGNLKITGEVMSKNRLHTVCEEARCPNLLHCWSKKTATFLAMGKECTRNCGFCSIDFNKAPKPLDENEPQQIVDSVRELGLRHVVITMVARDDLLDGGAFHLSKIIKAIKSQLAEVTVEVLTSDFAGNFEALDLLMEEKPNIFNHNVETVRRLSPKVRNKATYERSLEVLSYVKQFGVIVKSGLMAGLGENEEEVIETIKDLKEAGCDIVTIGQYLQADHKKLLVKAFIHPNVFKKYEQFGYSIGIKYMYCGPFVRSSFNAEEAMLQLAGKT